MDHPTLIAMLRRHVGETLQAPREAGRQTLAEALAASASIPEEQALRWVDELEAAGALRYKAVDALPKDSMLEAARYGTVPLASAEHGEWHIGPEH